MRDDLHVPIGEPCTEHAADSHSRDRNGTPIEQCPDMISTEPVKSGDCGESATLMDKLKQLRAAIMSKRASLDATDGRDDFPTSSSTTANVKKAVMDPNWAAEQANKLGLDISRISSMDPFALACVIETKENEIESLRSQLENAEREINQVRETEADKLRDMMDILKNELREKNDIVEDLEVKLAVRDRRVKRLNEDLAGATRRAIELEVQLELHDFKYISHQNYKKTSEQRVSKGANGHEGATESRSDDSESYSQVYVEKLMSDMQELEHRYLAATADYARNIAKAQVECNDLREIYEKDDRCIRGPEELQDGTISTTDSRDTKVSVPRVRVLEAENERLSQLVSNLTLEVESLKESLKRGEQKNEMERNFFNRKNKTLEGKVEALKAELVRKVTGGMCQERRMQYYKKLEANFDEHITEITDLEDRLRTKDRIISRLRARAVERCLGTGVKKPPVHPVNEENITGYPEDEATTLQDEANALIGSLQMKLIGSML